MLSRRRFLACCAGAAGSLVAPSLFAKSFDTDARNLKFYNVHTDEWLSVTYWENGAYWVDALSEINQFLRDHRTGDVHPIDRDLLDNLFAIRRTLEIDKTFHVISGYRSPKTNEMLRANSHGVAKKSLHMQGRAIDVRLPNVDSRQLQQVALALNTGGVGYYAKSDFVHLDTGKPRFW